MGRADHRGGQAPLRTASELALLLPVPLMMIVGGYASPSFPRSDRSNPSPAVGIVPTKPRNSYPTSGGRFPIYIHWTQWEAVVVPLFQDGRLTVWRGTHQELGEAVILLNDIVGPGGVVQYPLGLDIGISQPSKVSLGKLYACDPFDADRVGGKTAGYLNALMGMVYDQATQAGY
jgi:hypothetical protein